MFGKIEEDRKNQFCEGDESKTEWPGIRLSGNEQVLGWWLRLEECCDHILTAPAAFSIEGQMKPLKLHKYFKTDRK